MALDMAGLEVGTGSACASGSSLPGRVLLAMGYSEDRAKSGIRISVGPYFNMDNSTQVYKSLESILKRFLN